MNIKYLQTNTIYKKLGIVAYKKIHLYTKEYIQGVRMVILSQK